MISTFGPPAGAEAGTIFYSQNDLTGQGKVYKMDLATDINGKESPPSIYWGFRKGKTKSMEKVKIVCRYMDGKMVKGYTQDFFPNKPSFHIFPTENSNLKESVEVFLRELKAIFFVRDFTGRPDYDERKQYTPSDRPSGRIVEVTFTDGETLVGSTLGYDPKRSGFFIFPADPKSNNARVFALSKAVRLVRYL